MTIGGTHAVWHGVANRSILKCIGMGSGARLKFTAARVDLLGITFDGNGATVTTDAWGVHFGTTALKVRAEKCIFKNAAGSAIGYGAFIEGNGTTLDGFTDASFDFIDCDFHDNARSGFWAQAADRVTVHRCKAWDNDSNGIRLDTQDSTFAKTNRRSIVSECYAWRNGEAGIAVGNFNPVNTSTGITWEPGFYDVRSIVIAHCHTWENTSYGINISGGAYIEVRGCHSTDNGSSEMLANAAESDIIGRFYSVTKYVDHRRWGWIPSQI